MTDAPRDVPNPGSREAINQGCECPVIDNGYGCGFRGREGHFVITEGCPLHAPCAPSETKGGGDG